jgi:hypothetical protein
MKYLLSVLILITSLGNCKKPNKNDDNLLLGLFFLSQRSNFEFQFVGSNSSSSRNSKNTSSDKILNMQGIPIDEYGDGTTDGFQDKFGSASSVSLYFRELYFWKSGNISMGAETAENADLVIEEYKRYQQDPNNYGPLGNYRLTISRTNEFISKNLPLEVLSGDYDRIGISFKTLNYTFDSDVLADVGILSIVATDFVLYDSDVEFQDKGRWYSYNFTACREGSDYNLQTCTYLTHPTEFPYESLNNIAFIDKITGYFNGSMPGNEYDRTQYLPTGNEGRILRYGGNRSKNRDINKFGYFKEIPTTQNTNQLSTVKTDPVYIMPIRKGNESDDYQKLKIVVNASNVLHWDSNSQMNRFKSTHFPIFKFNEVPLAATTCKSDPRPGKESQTICYDDAYHPSIVPDFNSVPWSDNQEAPNPAIGKDMNIYLPAMYAELE